MVGSSVFPSSSLFFPTGFSPVGSNSWIPVSWVWSWSWLWFVPVFVSVVPAQIKRGQHGLPFSSTAGTFLPAVAAWLLAPVASITAPAIRYIPHPLLTAKTSAENRQNTKAITDQFGEISWRHAPSFFCPITIILSTISVIVSPLTIDLFPILSLPTR